MKSDTFNRHMIDLVFPVAVFFVFAASSLAVLILSARLYSTQTEKADNHYTTRTSLAYVNEKIRQGDTNGGIFIRKIEDRECLAIKSDMNGISYTTYIYAADGMLKELFVRDDAPLHLADARTIMEVNDFTMEEIGANLFRFTSADSDGNTSVLIASERSVP